MKKILGLVALIALLVFPLCATAATIDMQITWSNPTGYVTFPDSEQGNYFLDYGANLKDGTALETFCVENQAAPRDQSQFYTYALNSVDTGSKYETAAYIADNFFQGNYSKAAAQIAIWETILTMVH